MVRLQKRLFPWTIAILLAASSALWSQEPAQTPENPLAPEEQAEVAPPSDWAAQLLDAIVSSPNPQAVQALHDASFAAGPAIVPYLEVSLKDDRTAEFAAQSLAYIGGEKALQALWALVADPRDLNLRRFYYSALAEFSAPEAIQTLLDVIKRSDTEPDRTVTEAAILALTVHSDPNLAAQLRKIEKEIQDVVIRADLENAIDIIELRARYLATPEGKSARSSIQNAVRSYFMPALQAAPPPPVPVAPSKTTAKRITSPPPPLVKVDIQKLVFSPDKGRALAHVVFEDPTAQAFYDIVVQKQYGEWTVASVWLVEEVEKPQPPAATKPRR